MKSPTIQYAPAATLFHLSLILLTALLFPIWAQERDNHLRAVERKRAAEEESTRELRSRSLCFSGIYAANGMLDNLYSKFRFGRKDIPIQGIFYEPHFTTTESLKDMIADRAEAVVIGNSLTDTEKSILSKAYPDPKQQPELRPYMSCAVVILVHKSNPIRSLTYKQIDEIFRGKIKNWRAVGGYNGKIKRFGTKYPELSCAIFSNLALGGKPIRHRPDLPTGAIQEAELKKIIVAFHKKHPNGPFPRFTVDSKVINAVAKDPGAIGYCALPAAGLNSKQIRAVPIVPPTKRKAVTPTIPNILLGRYPLTMKFQFVLRPNASMAARAFVDFVGSRDAIETIEGVEIFIASARQ